MGKSWPKKNTILEKRNSEKKKKKKKNYSAINNEKEKPQKTKNGYILKTRNKPTSKNKTRQTRTLFWDAKKLFNIRVAHGTKNLSK